MNPAPFHKGTDEDPQLEKVKLREIRLLNDE